jgi:hypothetical protein
LPAMGVSAAVILDPSLDPNTEIRDVTKWSWTP